MKLAFSTVACIDLHYKEVVKAALKAGLDGVEIRLDDDNNICGLSKDALVELGDCFRKNCIKITDLGTSITFVDYEPEKIEKAMECVRMASEVGAAGVRVFLGNFLGKFSQSAFYSYEGILKSLYQLCSEAQKLDIEIWVETHNEFSTGKVLRKLIDDVNMDNLKIIWDIIHPIERGETPQETVKYIGDRISHIHIKDGKKPCDINKIDYIYTKLGEGDVSIGEVVDLLKNNGYNGYLSLEWEKPWRAEIADCYSDIKPLLSDFTELMQKIENNILPPISSGKWTTYVPECKSIAEFERGKYSESLNIKIRSDSFGVGKWICTEKINPGDTYDFSVIAKTDCEVNDIYVIATVFDKDENMITREHIRNFEKEEYGIRFYDKIQSTQNGVKLMIELWLKGNYCNVKWHSPILTLGEKAEKRIVKIALGYIEPQYEREHTIESNVAEILNAIDCSAKYSPDIILLSECMYERSVEGTSLKKIAQSDDGEMCRLVSQRAAMYNSYIIYNFHEVDNGEYYNTSVLFDRKGKICGKYRKTHLTVGELEKGMTPGSDYPVFETDFGKIGLLICFDHYFSSTAQKLSDNGAEIIFVSTAGDAAEKSIARAMDCGVYLAVCGLNNENTHGWGAARIINPDGIILADTNENSKPAFCEIDLNERVRRYWLSLGEADSEIYGVYRFERNNN